MPSSGIIPVKYAIALGAQLMGSVQIRVYFGTLKMVISRTECAHLIWKLC